MHNSFVNAAHGILLFDVKLKLPLLSGADMTRCCHHSVRPFGICRRLSSRDGRIAGSDKERL
jgi:hypothetical protein